MVNVSGRGKVTVPTLAYDNGTLDMTIEYARRKSLILVSDNYLLKQAMIPIKRGDMVRFEGFLDESEPGYYQIKLSHIEKVSKAKG